MHIDSARELKHSLTGRLPDLGVHPDGERWMGFGVAKRDDAQHSLAVRVSSEADVSDVLARVSEEARDEIDVREVGTIEPQYSIEELRGHRRPLVPGCSVAHQAVTAGTLGGFVTVDGQVHMLSNNHVLGHSDLGHAGDLVMQPGHADGGRCPDDAVGTLSGTVNLTPGYPNFVDAAVAQVAPGVRVAATDYPGGVLGEPLGGPPATDVVAKVGRTTGHTLGVITAFEVDGLPIMYPEGRMVFHDQIEIAGLFGGFSTGGDSGSVIWTHRERRPVGLLFAGSKRGGPGGTGMTYANLLVTALRELGAVWLGDGAAGSGWERYAS